MHLRQTRSMTITNDSDSFIIGLLLAISSSLFIGSSFIIKKIALRKSHSNSLRASAGGYAYLKQWLWWLGFLTMGLGEAANLTAYAFAPAAVVTPLGALSVLVSAMLSSYFLKEKLNILGKMGCFLCIVGSVITILHAPKEQEMTSMNDITSKLFELHFIIYVCMVLGISFIFRVYLVPRYGKTNIIIYLLLCSGIGSLTVVFCKAVALGIRETIEGKVNNFNNLILWALIIASVFCVIVQMNYLNKSLDIFNTSVVTPVYYVMFTFLVLTATGILFREWSSMPGSDIVGSLCGFLVVITAVFLLNAFKNVKVTFTDNVSTI